MWRSIVVRGRLNWLNPNSNRWTDQRWRNVRPTQMPSSSNPTLLQSQNVNISFSSPSPTLSLFISSLPSSFLKSGRHFFLKSTIIHLLRFSVRFLQPGLLFFFDENCLFRSPKLTSDVLFFFFFEQLTCSNSCCSVNVGREREVHVCACACACVCACVCACACVLKYCGWIESGKLKKRSPEERLRWFEQRQGYDRMFCCALLLNYNRYFMFNFAGVWKFISHGFER